MRLNTYHRIVMMISLFFLVISTSYAESIQWRTYSKSIFTSAKSQKKLVLVYGKSNLCHWCTKMNNDTLSNADIIHLISAKYIPVTIDVLEDRALAKQYQIQGTPTFIILDGNQKQVSESYGYQSVSEFKSFLENAE